MMFILLLIWIVGLCLGAPIGAMTLGVLGLAFVALAMWALANDTGRSR